MGVLSSSSQKDRESGFRSNANPSSVNRSSFGTVLPQLGRCVANRELTRGSTPCITEQILRRTPAAFRVWSVPVICLRFQHPQLIISKRKLRHADAIQMVRQKRETEAQNLGFSSQPFVLCGLPVKRPPAGCLLHERRNGRFVLQVTGHPSYGLPWGTGSTCTDLPGDNGRSAAIPWDHL
jgi:hypothetical protein